MTSEGCSVCRILLVATVVLLSWGTQGMALGSTGRVATQEFSAPSKYSQFTHGVLERVQAASKIQMPETADAVLIRTKEWKWNRYLQNALNLPDWIDLGLEHRTRFGVYDHL